MDRLFCRKGLAAALLTLVLLPSGTMERIKNQTQPVFFSMLFPQLMPDMESFRWEIPAWLWAETGAMQEGIRL